MKELVSQAEKEGVSLGIMISQRMSPEEIELAQMELSAEICANHDSIADFMADVRVPSVMEILSRDMIQSRTEDELSSDEISA